MLLRLSILIFALAVTAAVEAPTIALAQPDVAAKPPAPTPPKLLGPALWNGARIGMSPDDIAARFAKAAPSKGELLPGGAKSALMLATQIGGAPASAQFYFDDHGLSAIIIDRPDVVAHKTEENLAKAHHVVDQLTAEHGQPKTCTEQRRLAALNCVWMLGEAKAILSYRDIAGAAPALNVSYRAIKDVKPWAPGPVKKLKPR